MGKLFTSHDLQPPPNFLFSGNMLLQSTKKHTDHFMTSYDTTYVLA